jgi:hypothetical protein
VISPEDSIDRFALALDRDDFDSAITMLSADCVYETAAETLSGPEAVIKSFRDATQWAHKNLDTIIYVHSIEPCQDCDGAIRFIDDVTHSGKSMQHQCLMHVSLTELGLISKLRLEDLPGEKQKVSDFLQAVGVKR